MESAHPHHVIYIPGLGNGGLGCRLLQWRRHDPTLAFHVLKVDWGDGGSFASKLDRVLNVIDTFTQTGEKVSLIGSSAGGTMAVNALMQRPDKVDKVITICSPLRTGGRSHPLLERKDGGFPLVKAALARLDASGASLTPSQRKNILVFLPLYDGVVPPLSMVLEGTTNKKFFGFAHFPSLIITLIFYPGTIFRFLKAG